jgi:hypothetical protein
MLGSRKLFELCQRTGSPTNRGVARCWGGCSSSRRCREDPAPDSARRFHAITNPAVVSRPVLSRRGAGSDRTFPQKNCWTRGSTAVLENARSEPATPTQSSKPPCENGTLAGRLNCRFQAITKSASNSSSTRRCEAASRPNSPVPTLRVTPASGVECPSHRGGRTARSRRLPLRALCTAENAEQVCRADRCEPVGR